jgi:hypothetical protein
VASVLFGSTDALFNIRITKSVLGRPRGDKHWILAATVSTSFVPISWASADNRGLSPSLRASIQRKFKRRHDFIFAKWQGHDGGACSSLTSLWQCHWVFLLHRGDASSCLERASRLDHPETLLDKCPDPWIYINPLSPEAPLPFTFSAPHGLSLVHPYLPPSSSLQDLKRDGFPRSLPHRLLHYPRRSTIRFFGDSS